MVIGLIFLLMAFSTILLLWGGSILLQGWMYQNPADRLPIRAVVCGTVFAVFITFWCYIDSKNPGRYDTVFEFSPLEITDFDEFESVLKNTSGKEKITTFKKQHGSKGSTSEFADAKNQPWKKNTSDAQVVAILIKEKDKAEPTRFDAKLDAKGNFPAEIRYTDAAGRWMGADTLGRVYRSKTGVLFANIFLNVFHFVLWWMILWVGMRFNLWHALGLAMVIWPFVMIAVQPVLFTQTRTKEEVKVAMIADLYAAPLAKMSHLDARRV